ncbi:MAG: site-specific DNA-methyltransferase, partial [Sphingobacteriaceae bacterium]
MPTLHWIGKDKVINHHLDVPYKVLEHQYRFSAPSPVEKAGDEANKIIHGDNLEALKSLLPEYEGKIKCIYIDPPYNTGNESWVYNDNVNDPKIKKWLGNVVGKEAEDLTRHDKWLCMMYPRLKLLHKLLADDGAIFISIDDNEQANLKLMLDEIFGGGNFLSNVIWNSRKSVSNDAIISLNHNHTLIYTKNFFSFREKKHEFKLKINDVGFSNPDNDPRGAWTADPFDSPGIRPNLTYLITNPNTGETFLPPKERCWRTGPEEYQKLFLDKRIVFGKTGKSKPQLKRFFSDAGEKGKTPTSIWSDVGTATNATQEIQAIFLDKTFATPKPTTLIERILQLSTDKNSIVLDSFAGSGTTAHAVLNLNKQDGGNRKFILIEMETYAETITAERVKRVINGYGNTEGTGGSFDFYTLGEPLFLEDGLLNENLPLQKIREYIW